MEARYVTLILAALSLSNVAASYSSRNFIVSAPTPEIARQIAERAEECRTDIAKWWLGYELKPWLRPCEVIVQVGQMGSGGATTFAFDRGEVGDWKMNVQGSLERIMDSVIPHEVSHTVFACHFRRPLPRWADEGAATVIEHPVERERQKQLVRHLLKTNQKIPLRELLQITEYPSDMQQVLNLYAEGYTLCEWLVFHWGQKNYLAFVNAAHQEGWDQAIASHYPYKSVEELEQGWMTWINEGMSTPQHLQPELQLAENSEPTEPEQPAQNNLEGEVRGQAPDVRSIESTPGDEPNPRRVAKAPPTRRRMTETPRESGASKAPTTGDVVLGEPGDILAAVEALSDVRNVSSGKARGGVERPSRGSVRSLSSPDEESFEERESDARRSSASRGTSKLRGRIASGHQRNPETVDSDETDSVEVGDTTLRPEPRPVSRIRNVTPDQSETPDREPLTGQRSASRGVGRTAAKTSKERYRRGRVTDWNGPVDQGRSKNSDDITFAEQE